MWLSSWTHFWVWHFHFAEAKAIAWPLLWSPDLCIKGLKMGKLVWKPILLKRLVVFQDVISKVLWVFRFHELRFSWQEGFNFKMTRHPQIHTGTFHWQNILPFAHLVTVLFLQYSLNTLQAGMASRVWSSGKGPCALKAPPHALFNPLFPISWNS